MKYPVGGPREPVYALMRELGFTMAHFSDKVWNRDDGMQVCIYGAGSRARITPKYKATKECNLDDLAEQLADVFPIEHK